MQAKTIVYVTRDIERATGKAPGRDYAIISNRDRASLSTYDLLKEERVRELLAKPGTSLMVFKNTPQIEALAKENGWQLLNPAAELAEKIENKITQVEILGDLAKKYLPEFSVGPTRDIVWAKQPLVIQWAHGHTGDGTILVNSAPELKVLQDRFPDRPARTSPFVRGPSFTVNAVAADDILIGNPSYQITGLPPFTDLPFATVGNDWSLTHSLLSESELTQLETMVREVGLKLKAAGWRGLFGIDLMRDDERDRLCLIEINARQPASTSFESLLQKNIGLPESTVFEAHLAALQGLPIQSINPLNDGAQIIQRVTKTITSIADDVAGSLELAGYISTTYPNTEYNSDLIRVQSSLGIMETHGRLNKRGEEIRDIIEQS